MCGQSLAVGETEHYSTIYLSFRMLALHAGPLGLCKTKLGHPTLWICSTWGLPFHPNVHFSREGQWKITYIHPQTHTRKHPLFPVTSMPVSIFLEIQRVLWAESSSFAWLWQAMTHALFIGALLLGKGFHCEGIGPCDWLGHNPTNSCSSMFLIHCPVITGPAAASKNTHKGRASAERAGKPSPPPLNLSKRHSHQHWLLMHFFSLGYSESHLSN